MANVNNPRGLRAITAGIAGTAPRVTEYPLTVSVTVYEGAVVTLDADGKVKPLAIGTTTNIAVTGTKSIVGVAAHYQTHGATGTKTVLVYDDPAQRFVVDTGALTTLKQATLGAYARVLNNTTGNTTTLQSKAVLNVISAAVTQGVVKFVGIFNTPGDVATTSHRDVVVQFVPTRHIYTHTVTAISV